MLKVVLLRISQNLVNLEHNVAVALGLRWPPVAFEFTLVGDKVDDKKPVQSLADIVLNDIREGLLWAVPTSRRSLQKRNNRRYGVLEYHWKLFRPKKNLLPCMHCGHWHEPAVLCPHCYRKVMAETNLLKDKIVETLGLNPVEQEVVILYKDDIQSKPSEYFEGKRIVEIDRPRPSWWNENLAQPSTQQPSDSKEIKPVDMA